MTASPPLLTTKDLLALPNDGRDRWLIRGRIWEPKEVDVTKRNRFHAELEARIAQLLGMWLDDQPEPRGQVYAGEAGVILRHEPETTVGIDLVYVSAEVVANLPNDTTMIDGIPALAVEILSPSTTIDDRDQKLRAFAEAGVPLVWLVDPKLRTVTVLRPDLPPAMLNVTDTLTAEPHLPGFAVPVSRLFAR